MRVKYDRRRALVGSVAVATVAAGVFGVSAARGQADTGDVRGFVDFTAIGSGEAIVEFIQLVNVEGEVQPVPAEKTRTQDDGTFEAELAPGEYVVYLHNGDSFGQTYWGAGGAAESAPSFTVSSDSSTDLGRMSVRPAGSIEGRVVDDNGAAIAGAKVVAGWREQTEDGGALPAVPIGATADADGEFVLEGLLSGPYAVSVLTDESHLDGMITSGQKSDSADAGVVNVQSGEVTDVDTVVLNRASEVTGTITDSSGKPIEGVEVSVVDDASSSQGTTSASTDADGRFEIGKLPDGEFQLDVTADEAFVSLAADRAPRFRVGRAGSTDVGEIQLADAGALTGSVTDPTGEGVEAVTVVAFQPDAEGGWSAVAQADTDKSGAYALRGLEPARTVVWVASDHRHEATYFGGAYFVEKARRISVEGGKETTLDAIQLRVGSAVDGQVTSATGAPLPNVMVVASLKLPNGEWSPEAGCQTDEAGHYSLGGLTDGEYKVTFTQPSSEDDDVRSETRNVSVDRGSRQSVSVKLEEGK